MKPENQWSTVITQRDNACHKYIESQNPDIKDQKLV